MNWAERQSEPKVHEVVTLGWEKDAEVKEMLARITKQVRGPCCRWACWEGRTPRDARARASA